MNCKKGFVHSFAYFSILDKKCCIHCGIDKSIWSKRILVKF